MAKKNKFELITNTREIFARKNKLLNRRNDQMKRVSAEGAARVGSDQERKGLLQKKNFDLQLRKKIKHDPDSDLPMAKVHRVQDISEKVLKRFQPVNSKRNFKLQLKQLEDLADMGYTAEDFYFITKESE
eukprot:CAMPEP_0170552678 /NCGR_PEP_ID=MMETSP0211-20121228/10552_1 /TAXON_ID=311385 /ORGANISM="Pseudokeronopsis sp., Strain OXSARD2" /LENGTH=129 /DNA_ID=CAMNT_0010860555 /DNA_START=75 /DNA_END=464 /DNA_ORIENTATION=+